MHSQSGPHGQFWHFMGALLRTLIRVCAGKRTTLRFLTADPLSEKNAHLRISGYVRVPDSIKSLCLKPSSRCHTQPRYVLARYGARMFQSAHAPGGQEVLTARREALVASPSSTPTKLFPATLKAAIRRAACTGRPSSTSGRLIAMARISLSRIRSQTPFTSSAKLRA
jgi:hypothetical protein